MSIAAVILAAGASSRLGRPKQLEQFEGESLLRRTARVALEGGCEPVLVVLGANADVSCAEIVDLPVRVLHHEQWSTGMASTISCGVAALPPNAEGAILLVCDQPHLSAALLQDLLARRGAPNTIIASRYADTVGVPALFERVHFTELIELSGDVGAKSLFAKHANATTVVNFPRGAVDIDSPADADALAAQQRA